MKTSNVLLVCLSLTATAAQAQVANSPGATVPPPTPYQVVDVGLNHRVMQRQEFELMPNGQIVPRTHTYTELASGLNFQDPTTGQYLPSENTIEAFAGGAILRHSQQQIIFANNLNSPGAVDVQTHDHNRLRSNILGLLYVDPATGQAAEIAGIRDSEGELIANNEVLYPNALEGVDADVLYKTRLDGMEQNIIIRTQLPSPESVGMPNSPTVELEAFTEFLSPPAANVADLETETQGVEADQAVSWGATHLGRGKAFILGGEDTPVIVVKRYITVGARVFLLEKVRLMDIQQALSKLPQQASNAKRLPGMASTHFTFPQGPATKSASRPMRLAEGSRPDKGYVLDYTSLGTAYTNYTFLGDMTYYVSSALNLYGTNIYECGTVLKYAANASITAVAGSQVAFHFQKYNPIVFSAKDDNTTGEAISGSTGSPSGFYANPALNLSSMGGLTLPEFRIAYANKGLSVSGTSPTIYDAQFVHCATAISDVNGTVTLENVLFSNIKTNFNATSSANTIYLQNATFNNAFDLINGSFGSTGIYVTNCVFVNVTNLSGTISAGCNGFYQTPMVGSQAATNTFYPLQTAGTASCYLTNGCTFLTNGTANLFPGLSTLLSQKTTMAPIIYSNLTFSVNTNFGLAASRDTNATPEPGYHYDPLDYVFGNVIVQSNVSFSAGTAVGWFEANSTMTGISLTTGGSLTFQGTVTAPCNFARYYNVQEGGNGLWTAKGYLGGIVFNGNNSGNRPLLSGQFTKFEGVAGTPNQFRDSSTYGAVALENSEIYGGNVGSYNSSYFFTNCLFCHVCTAFYSQGSAASVAFDNCTFDGGCLILCRYSGQSASFWNIENTAFDGSAFVVADNLNGATNSTLFNYNAYNTNNLSWQTYNSGYAQTNTLEVVGAQSIMVTNYNWQTSWFGNYYLPAGSPLIQMGSTNANLLGLYHFTTQTNQVPETNSIVTMSYHYVATDAYGNPLDTNGDGIPDYLEDANGNGIFDTGDLGEWTISPFGLNRTSSLVVFTPLK